MALISCPECSKSVSDQSVSCPNCGFPTPKSETLNSHVPPPLPQMNYNNSNSLAGNRKRQKNSGCSGATIFLIIIIIAIGYWLMDSYDSYTEKARQYNEDQSEPSEESYEVEESLLDSELTQIPMLLSGSGEDGRYFLISHSTSYELEHIDYVRRGKESDAYGQMQINCTNHEIRKSSSESFKALASADLGDWYTPTPDWTDQDIVNFICPTKTVVSKNIEHHKVVEKVTLEQFKPEPVISVEARPREVLLSNAPSGSEKEYKVWETPIETKELYNEKVVNKEADDKKERDIARRKSDDRAICEQAIKVNNAYLGKDEPEYSQWKAIERANCMQDKLYE